MIAIAEHADLASGLKGGVLIGLSSTLLLAIVGRISGMSGMVASTLKAQVSSGAKWDGFADSSVNSLFYIGGLMTAGWICQTYYPHFFGNQSTVPYHLNMTGIAAAAALTAFGVSYGSGCTSGHGVCGLPRRSIRSLVAVMTFMATGALTTYFVREFGASTWPINTLLSPSAKETEDSITAIFSDSEGKPKSTLFIILSVFVSHLLYKYGGGDSGAPGTNRAGLFQMAKQRREEKAALPFVFAANFSSFVMAVLFGVALGLSGMTDMCRVYNFLDFSNTRVGWDPTLMGVMGGAVMVNLFTFEALSRLKFVPMLKKLKLLQGGAQAPSMESTGLHTIMGSLRPVDTELVVGAALFGCGWGLGGVCPGPALVSLWNPASSYCRLFVPLLFIFMGLQSVVKRLHGDYRALVNQSARDAADLAKFESHNNRIRQESDQAQQRASRKHVTSTENQYSALQED